MTGRFSLDWAIMAVSLFNTILLLWLGLTVLLNAERRTWGLWLASGGLLMGGAFFFSHSAILGHGLDYWSQGMDFWWRAGWLPIVALPFVWYATMLWYVGFWDARQTTPRRRHQLGLYLTALLASGNVALLILGNPLPSFTLLAWLDLSAVPAVDGIPSLILLYSFYLVLCISLALDALRYPGPTERVMGDLARRRARPWLVAASVVLLLASLLVAGVMLLIVYRVRQFRRTGIYTPLLFTVAWFDLTIAALISVVMLTLGQAIVSYEVFTGKTLPRRGLWRYWRNAVVLAAGFGVVVGWSLAFKLRAIYSLLLSTLLMTFFYALLSWRSYVERERYIAHLRPFVASQRLYERLLSSSAPSELDTARPFRALCDDVLGARLAYLVAVGPLTPLAGPPLAYPQTRPPSLPPLTEVTAQFRSPQTMCTPLEPSRYGGATWAVPLWSERGLIGVLLLGAKRDGGLYTQEEIEIARASGERLVDSQASAEMARRLMALQRQRLTESQVLDHRARRALHDDVLPRLHALMLELSGRKTKDERRPPPSVPSVCEEEATPIVSKGEEDEVVAVLAGVYRQISDLLRDMPTSTVPEVARLGLVGALRRVVDEEFGGAFDALSWEVEPDAEREARRIPSLTAEVLFYAAREAVRNAARHGRDSAAARPLHLQVAVSWREGLQILVEDDGVGLGMRRPSDGTGGQGLALHSTMMAVVGGSLAMESVPGTYTRVLLTLPIKWDTDEHG